LIFESFNSPLANESQRLPSLKLHLSLAFDLNQPKFASRMLRANQDLPEEVHILYILYKT
jgi:hypothetical protein